MDRAVLAFVRDGQPGTHPDAEVHQTYIFWSDRKVARHHPREVHVVPMTFHQAVVGMSQAPFPYVDNLMHQHVCQQVTQTAEVTALLRAWSGGDHAALEQLMPLVYAELRRMTGRYMQRERQGNTLQATALVNEAFLRLVDVTGVRWQNRAHFFAISAQMMRRILVDAARARGSGKRGGGLVRLNLNESIDALPEPDSRLVELDEALESLARFDARKAKAVELRFFGGPSVEEAAEVLKISPQSVLRDWRLARAWLMGQLSQ